MSRLVETRGFTPDLIGKVVSVNVLRKKQGIIVPETSQRTTGILEAYYENAQSKSGSFIIRGYSPRQFASTEHVGVYVIAEPDFEVNV